MPKTDLNALKAQLITAQNELNKAMHMVDVSLGLKTANLDDKARIEGGVNDTGDERVVEGVFDGSGMVGPDGKQYTVPANYASKSKLVEGDMLKLTIRPDGSFLFKQIGPVERERLVGVLAFDDQTRQYFGVINGKSYQLLTASVTYYKGDVGDEVIMLVPVGSECTWAAVENVVKQLPVRESIQKEIVDESATDEEPASLEDVDMLEPKSFFDETDDIFKIE